MKKSIKKIVLTCLLATFCATPALAASDVKFPADWKSWIKMKEYPFPCDKVAELPTVLQNVGTIYCPILTENSLIKIWARPESKAVLDKKGKEMPDGANFVFEVTEAKGLGDVLLVKAHNMGDPIYGVFKADGTDIEGVAVATSKGTCVSCHDAYCRPYGVCSDQPWNK